MEQQIDDSFTNIEYSLEQIQLIIEGRKKYLLIIYLWS